MLTNKQIEVLRSLLRAYQLTSMQEESEALTAAISLAQRVRDAPVVLADKWIWENVPEGLDGKRVALVRVE